MVDSHSELLALAEKELLAPQKEPTRPNGALELSESATALRKLRKRAISMLPKATSLLGLVSSSSSSTSTASAATPPAWPRREIPVLPTSAKHASSSSKVPRVVRNQVLMRLAAEHALLLAAAVPTTTTSDDVDNNERQQQHLTSLLVSTVASSPAIRRSATSLALRQEESTLYRVATGKETYLSLSRKTTALSAKTSAAEVLLLRREEEERKKKKSSSSAPAPAPNPTPLPLPRKKEEKEEEEGKEKEGQLQLVEVDFDDGALLALKQKRPPPPPTSSLSDPRSAILDVISSALRPLVEGSQVSSEVAAAATERSLSKVLAAFESKKTKKEKGDVVSAFLTDSQRAKISQFARDCLEAEDAKAQRKRQRLE